MTPEFKRILLPTRFTVLSERAAAYVETLVSRFDAELHVLYVVPHTELIVDPGMPPVSMPVAGPHPSELLVDAERRLTEFVGTHLPGVGARAKTFSIVGGITDEIIEHAREHEIDLIVMGTHADGMLKRLVFGSVGKGVLEGAPCPVLLVPVRGAPR